MCVFEGTIMCELFASNLPNSLLFRNSLITWGKFKILSPDIKIGY